MVTGPRSGFSNDPLIQGIAARVRSAIDHPAPELVDALATMLALSPEKFRQLITEPERAVDVAFLLETIAAMVRAVGVDPHWALTGEFDAAVHRDAMLLAEDRSTAGDHALREFVSVQFRELRRDSRSPKERSE